MKRTRKEILWGIEYCTNMAEECTKLAEYCTNKAKEAKQELKEFDAKEKGE